MSVLPSISRSRVGGRFNRARRGQKSQVDSFDPDERRDDAAESIDEQIPAQQRGRAHRPVGDAPQRKRDQGDDDQRIEDDRRENRALRTRQVHDIQRVQPTVTAGRDRQRRTSPG